MQNFDSFAADFIEETCANPSAEDAVANFLQTSDKIGDLMLQVPEVERYEKVQNYVETVCGYEKNPYCCTQDLEDLGGLRIYVLYQIPTMLDIIQDIQENSKDLKCKYRIYCNKHFQPDI